jgi:hypothetical protein
MPHQLYEDAYGDPRNAAALANACQITYFEPVSGAATFQSDLGLDNAKLISVDNTQAYVAENADHVLVAFRGSQDPTNLDGIKDWLLTNAFNLLVQPLGPLSTEFLAAGVDGRWHAGFITAITEVWDPLYAEVDARLKAKDRCFWVTGHSLGGALALLGAWLFKRKFVNVHQVYTFGAPMVGNKAVADAYDREFPGKIFRYVNTPDPVPLLPMVSLVSNEFTHCNKLVSLGPEAEAANLISYLGASAGEVAGGILAGDIAEKVWGAIKGKLLAHLLNDYRKLIAPG